MTVTVLSNVLPWTSRKKDHAGHFSPSIQTRNQFRPSELKTVSLQSLQRTKIRNNFLITYHSNYDHPEGSTSSGNIFVSKTLQFVFPLHSLLAHQFYPQTLSWLHRRVPLSFPLASILVHPTRCFCSGASWVRCPSPNHSSCTLFFSITLNPNC